MEGGTGVRVGVGVDLVAVDRIRRLLRDNPQAEADMFTEVERGYCHARRDPYPHLAARFAAKESVLKALGTGLGPRMRWTDVGVVNAPLGRPSVTLTGEASAVARAQGVASVEISLSHTGDYAIAQAVLVLEGPPCAST